MLASVRGGRRGIDRSFLERSGRRCVPVDLIYGERTFWEQGLHPMQVIGWHR